MKAQRAAPSKPRVWSPRPCVAYGESCCARRNQPRMVFLSRFVVVREARLREAISGGGSARSDEGDEVPARVRLNSGARFGSRIVLADLERSLCANTHDLRLLCRFWRDA